MRGFAWDEATCWIAGVHAGSPVTELRRSLDGALLARYRFYLQFAAGDDSIALSMCADAVVAREDGNVFTTFVRRGPKVFEAEGTCAPVRTVPYNDGPWPVRSVLTAAREFVWVANFGPYNELEVFHDGGLRRFSMWYRRHARRLEEKFNGAYVTVLRTGKVCWLV